MLHILQGAKKLISITLVTLFLVTSTLLSFPSPAKAAGNIVVFNCESNCNNNGVAFAAGVVSGSAVTLAATGNAATIAAVGTTIGQAATVMTGITTAGSAVVSAPVVLPVAATAVVGYGSYRVWKAYHNRHADFAR
jgi:hypothetical protein